MYRVFCESYENYKKQYNDLYKQEDYRYKIITPFELIRNTERYLLEQSKGTLLYKQLSDLIFYMESNLDRYPKISAFLWTLESREIKGQKYGVVSEEHLEEQTKLVNMFLSLIYWDEAGH